MPNPINVQSTSNVFIETSDSVFSDGKDGSTALKATPSVTVSKVAIFDGTAFQYLKQVVTGSITLLTGIINTVNLGRYNATPFTLNDGDHRALQLNYRAELLVSNSIYSLTNRGGTTSSTANTITQVIAANPSRRIAKIQSPYGNSVILQVLIGASGSEFVDVELSPGDAYAVPSSDRVSIRCPTTINVPFYASEG